MSDDEWPRLPADFFPDYPIPTDDLRELLIRADSVCSYVAARGLDNESRAELRAVALACRKLYQASPNDGSETRP